MPMPMMVMEGMQVLMGVVLVNSVNPSAHLLLGDVVGLVGQSLNNW